MCIIRQEDPQVDILYLGITFRRILIVYYNCENIKTGGDIMNNIPTNRMTFTKRDPVMGYTFQVKVIRDNDDGTVDGTLDVDNMSTAQKILAHFI